MQGRMVIATLFVIAPICKASAWSLPQLFQWALSGGSLGPRLNHWIWYGRLGWNVDNSGSDKMIEIGKLNALGLWWFLCRWESAMAVNGDPWCVSGAMCHWCWRCGHTFLAALTRPFSGYRGCDHRPGISPAAGSGPRPAGHMVPTLVTVTARLTTASLAHTSCFYTVYSLPSQWLQMKCNIGFIS